MRLEQALSRAQQSEREKGLTMEKYKNLEAVIVALLDVIVNFFGDCQCRSCIYHFFIHGRQPYERKCRRLFTDLSGKFLEFS